MGARYEAHRVLRRGVFLVHLSSFLHKQQTATRCFEKRTWEKQGLAVRPLRWPRPAAFTLSCSTVWEGDARFPSPVQGGEGCTSSLPRRTQKRAPLEMIHTLYVLQSKRWEHVQLSLPNDNMSPLIQIKLKNTPTPARPRRQLTEFPATMIHRDRTSWSGRYP